MNFLATPVLSILRRRHPVSMARVSEILSNLNFRKPAGPDEIPPKLLKIAAPVIAGPMTKLFNYCIDVGEWPCQWKLSNVTPVHKKDDETSKTTYRPISVLSVIPKPVFEKLQFDQLYSVFTPVFSDNMSGFLRGHSCCSALLKLTDDWRQALDNKKDVAVIAIDLSKVFDSICHNLLLAKLKAYGVHDSAIKLIQSYLSGRFQREGVRLAASSLWSTAREPSRSAFLNIFVNDVNFSAGSSSLRLYADDTTQYIAHESPCTLESTLNQDIERLSLWFTANYLQVNATKTQAMKLGKSQYPYNLFIGDRSTEIEPTLKILGVTLDQDLSFEPHVAIMLKKAYAKIAGSVHDSANPFFKFSAPC